MTLILASNSASRQKILTNASIKFQVIGADVDEDTLKDEFLRDGCDHGEIAEQLALAKAMEVSGRFPEDHVIGGDQLLVCDGQLYSKARDMAEARDNLKFFRGKTHQLITSLVICKAGEEIWCTTMVPELTMRNFSDAFLDEYLERSGPDVLSSVGCYFYEGLGAQLFSDILGDYFSILGLPLIQLMEKLRQLGYLKT